MHINKNFKQKKVDLNRKGAYYSLKKHEKLSFLMCNTSQEFSNNIWLIYSGCSNHMIGNQIRIKNMDESIRMEVMLGSDDILKFM